MKTYIVKCKKSIIIEHVGFYFQSGSTYTAEVNHVGDIAAFDETQAWHIVAEGNKGGETDEWFVEHFDILETAEINPSF